jgi:hypothetical protein
MNTLRSKNGTFGVQECKETGYFRVVQVYSSFLVHVVTAWTRSKKKANKNCFELCSGLKTVKRFVDGHEILCRKKMPELFQ